MKMFWLFYALCLIGAAFYIVGCVSPRPPVYVQPHRDYIAPV